MIVNLIKKYKELILYGIFGLGATLVNIIAFYLLRKGGISLIPSNCLAWFFAFVFAFVTNKVIVFGSTDWKSGKAVYELITFTAARLGTLVVDTAMMYAMVDLMKINDLISKVVVNIVVIIINYVLSKFVIFNKKEDLRISKDTITDMITNIVNTVYNKTEWYRKNKFFNSMFFKYTVLFCITAFIAFLPFIRHHKSFIWFFDGQAIQYPAFVYLGKWGRKIIRGVINGNFNIPLYDFYIGLGSDVPQYLGMWYFEPISFLSILTPVKYAELMYNFLSVFRLYLAGLSFIYLCRYLNKKNIYAVLGAIVYVFTGYVFFFMRHPIFFSSLIYFPFLIVELDKTIRKNRISIKLVLMVGLSLFTSYYFLYVNTLLCGIYFLVVVISDKNIKKTFSNIAGMISKIAISYIWGVLLSLFAFLPVFCSYLDSNRTGSVINTDSLFIYDIKWLPKLFVFMFAPYGYTGYWLYNGFSITTLLTACLLFMKKGNTLLKRFLVIAVVFLCFPVFTYIFHGFNSIHHRWNYALALLLGLTIVYSMDSIYKIDKKKIKVLILPILLYILIILAVTSARTVANMIACIFGLLSFAVIYYIRVEEVKPWIVKTLMSMLIVSSCGINGYASYAPSMINYVNDFLDNNMALANQSNVSSNIKINKEQLFERRDKSYVEGRSFNLFLPDNRTINNSLILDYMGVSSYYNQRSKEYDEFNRMLENRDFDLLYVHDLDNRTFLDALYNVTYYTEFPGQEKFIPFGYEYVYKDLSGRRVYRNKYALHFGYTYDKYIEEKIFNKMSALDRQEMMLKGAYIGEDIDDDIKKNLSKENSKSSVKKLDYKVSAYNGLRIDERGKAIYVDTLPAKIVLEVETPRYSETYIRLNNLDVDKYKTFYEYVGIKGITQKNSVYKFINLISSKEIYSNKTYDFLINLGYHEESVKNIEIDFPKIGEYKLEDIEIYSQPMNDYKKDVDKLNQSYLKHIKWKNNSLSGTIETDKEKLMCLTIPYAKGWKAYVDGKAVKIYKTNIMFSGILISEGKHDITLTYFTPGLKTGIIVSFAAWTFLILYIILRQKIKKGKVN